MFKQLGFLCGLSVLWLVFFGCAPQAFADEVAIDSAAFAKAAELPAHLNWNGSVVTLLADRPKLAVAVNGTRLVSGLGLKAWASVTGSNEHAVLIGELPVLEGEVNWFIDLLLKAGLDVTALHNAFLFDKPRLMALHFSATGPAPKLGSALGPVFKKFSEGPHSTGAMALIKVNTAKTTLHPEKIIPILWKGEFQDGVYRVSTGRGTQLGGVAVGDSMGVNSWASFAGSDEAAVVTGDIAMLEYELPKVLRALVDAHIGVTSIHLHLTKETPKIIFIHYWGVGKVVDLAKGVKAALVVQKNFEGST